MVKYGKSSSFNNELSASELKSLDPDMLSEKIKTLLDHPHEILYYGPHSKEEMLKHLSGHKISDKMLSVGEKTEFPELDLIEPIVYFVDYDMVQSEITIMSKGPLYSMELIPSGRLFNEYFGSGLSSIVFQEMRESKALAYSVFSTYRLPKDTNTSHYLMSYIGTQADKLSEAMSGMTELLDVMPEAETNMNNAKEAIEQKIRTERLTKSRILSEYEKAQKLGINHDVRQDLYDGAQTFDIASLREFHNSHISSGTRVTMVLGSKEDLDLDVLKQYGEIKHLTLEDVFGY